MQPARRLLLSALSLALAASCGGLETPEPLKSELPEYPGARLLAVSTDGRAGAGVTFETEDDISAVIQFYTEEAQRRGWTVETDYTPGEIEYRPGAPKRGRHWSRGPYELRVVARKAAADEVTSVSVDITID
jgi:hypothetical protein